MGELNIKFEGVTFMDMNGEEISIGEMNTDDFLSSNNNVVNHTIPIKQCRGKIAMINKFKKSLKLYHIIHKCRYIAEHTKSTRIFKKQDERINLMITKLGKLYIG